MPTLRQVTCNIELSPSNEPLKEYKTVYHDGFVETYVAVPSKPSNFSIHLSTSGYIAEGISMFVYIDGVYQCNRYRGYLVRPDGTTNRVETEVDFRVRQKEERQGEEKFIGREWTFEALNISETPSLHASSSYN